MLEPILEICMPVGCSVLRATDITGDYNATTNPTGWGAPNDTPSVITEALINITYVNGTVASIDVTSQLVSAIASDIPFEDIPPTSGTTYSDQVLNIEYQLTNSSGTVYSYKFDTLLTCNAECCVETMWAGLGAKYCDTCNYEQYLKDCELADSLLTGVKAAFNCLNYTLVASILAKISTLCINNDCNCS